ncbi:MAG TPA: BT_3928 family protein [Bacteroidia bacterium]|nr:BT_3928 family protein [Bacteroidia bacterium]
MKKFIQGNFFKFILSAGLAVGFYFITPHCLSKTTVAGILVTLVILINASGFISKWPLITHIARVLVGGLFIFSGFIKSNDAVGFSYKLEEYFEVFKGDTGLAMFDWMAHISLPLAIIICVSEVALGFMLFIGFKKELILWLLLAQIVFFTFLTFYSACYNKVTHCGCFGDAIKLTPWESFWKDITLLILITLLFSGKDNINPLFGGMISNVLTVIAIAASIWFPIHCYRNLPVIDFRAYAPGLSICEGKKTGPNYKPAVYESHFMYKNIQSGDTTEFTDKNYPWQDTLHWKFHRALPSVVISPEVDAAKIPDFTITDLDGNNVTDTILGNKNYNFYLVCYDLNKTSQDAELMAKINDFYTICEKNKVNFIALTASSNEQINDFKHKFNALYDFYNMDGIVLKTMIRSNPGLMLMKDCRVVNNWHYNNFPVFSDVQNKFMK